MVILSFTRTDELWSAWLVKSQNEYKSNKLAKCALLSAGKTSEKMWKLHEGWIDDNVCFLSICDIPAHHHSSFLFANILRYKVFSLKTDATMNSKKVVTMQN